MEEQRERICASDYRAFGQGSKERPSQKTAPAAVPRPET